MTNMNKINHLIPYASYVFLDPAPAGSGEEPPFSPAATFSIVASASAMSNESVLNLRSL